MAVPRTADKNVQMDTHIIKNIKRSVRRSIFGFFKLNARKLLKTNTMPFLQIHLCEHCNLNCKGCAHFSPVAEKSFVDIEELKRMYLALQPYLEKRFSRLELMGGEPLLHPRIEDILHITRESFPGMEIRLVTNGILIDEMPESFFHACADDRITVYISIYPIGLDHESIRRKLDKYGIVNDFYGVKGENKKFISYRLVPAGNMDVKKNYRRCRLGGRCLQLKDGKIYPCFPSAYAGHLNACFHTGFSWEENDYLPTENVSEERFHQFINEPVPFCRYCDTAHQSKFEWGISKKDKREWLKMSD